MREQPKPAEELKRYPLEGGASVTFEQREDGKDKVLIANTRAGLPNGDGKYTESGAEIMRIRDGGEVVKRQPAFDRVAAAFAAFEADNSAGRRRLRPARETRFAAVDDDQTGGA